MDRAAPLHLVASGLVVQRVALLSKSNVWGAFYAVSANLSRRYSCRGVEPAGRCSMMSRVKLDAEISPSGALGGNAGRAGTGEGIEHELAGLGERLDQRVQYVDRFLGGMQLVAGVNPVHHVRRRGGRKWGAALEEQIGAFVPVLQKGGFRGVALAEDDMPGDTKARLFPCREEQIGLRPAIEADGEGVVFQRAVHLAEGCLQLGAVVVVEQRAVVAALVGGHVGRIGEDEIHAAGGERRQHIEAVAVDDGVAGSVHGRYSPMRKRALRRTSSASSRHWLSD